MWRACDAERHDSSRTWAVLPCPGHLVPDSHGPYCKGRATLSTTRVLGSTIVGWMDLSVDVAHRAMKSAMTHRVREN